MRSLPFVAVLFTAGLVVPVLAQSDSFEGQYSAGEPDYQQQMTIQQEGEEYRLRLSVKAPGCTGQAEATGTAKGKLLTAKTANGACTITALRAGPRLQVEGDDCEGLHGATCDFDGTYAPK